MISKSAASSESAQQLWLIDRESPQHWRAVITATTTRKQGEKRTSKSKAAKRWKSGLFFLSEVVGGLAESAFLLRVCPPQLIEVEGSGSIYKPLENALISYITFLSKFSSAVSSNYTFSSVQE